MPPMKGPNPRLSHTTPPIMQATTRELRRLLDLQATRNPQLQHALLNDPAAAIAVFRVLGQLRPGAFDTVSDAAHAISLIGMQPLRQMIETLPELGLDGAGWALRETAASAYSQAAHAAHYANALAEAKGLGGNHEVPTAALLQQPAMLALWADQPESAHRATSAMRDGVSFDQAFGAELGEPVADANRRLADAWSLPTLARQAMGDWDDFNSRPLLVKLADGLAQTTAAGWHGETLDSITAVLAEYLDCNEAAATTWLHQQSVEAARVLRRFSYPLPGFELLYVDADNSDTDHEDDARLPVLGAWREKEAATEAGPAAANMPDLQETMATAMRRIRQETGASRVIFAMLNRERNHLRTRLALGGEPDDAVRHLDLDLTQQTLFSLLMRKPQSVWLSRGNAKKYQAYLPTDLRKLFRPQGAYLMSLFVGERPLGLLFADGGGLSEPGYDRFRTLCREAAEILGKHPTSAI